MELTPRTFDDTGDTGDTDAVEAGEVATRARPRSWRRRWVPLAVLGVVLIVLGVLVFKGLSDATMYFRNADEAVAQRESLGTKRFRLVPRLSRWATASSALRKYMVA
ncbi:MAG TPA: cytochrome c maturation protein CcmE, partial [Acidimicrobiales bacterium]|nr:cytochrome c maturation protein CcmE [Acidimicrobiales bacterium]